MILKSRTQSLMAVFFALSLLVLSVGPISVRAHTFSPNESASFLSLVDQIKSALSTIKSDFSTKTYFGQGARTICKNARYK